jgi:peroxiredoxin
MKKTLTTIFSAVLALAVSATACGPKPEATVSGTVKNIADGAKVALVHSDGSILDSTVVKGGKFRLNIANASPNQGVLNFTEIGAKFPFFIEKGAIAVAVDASATPPTAHFTGTPTNDAMASFSTEAAKVTSYDQQLALFKKTIAANPSSIFAAYLTLAMSPRFKTPAQVDSAMNVVAGAPANYFTSQLVERREMLAATEAGKTAPDFTQNMVDGTPFTLSSMRGKLVLIDFWASWCGPCRQENPNVVKMYNRFAGKGFEIVGVSLDNNRENWLKAIADDKLTWTQVSDLKGWQNAVAQQYAVSSIPHTVLVGADGVILAKNLRGAALEAKIAEVLGVK